MTMSEPEARGPEEAADDGGRHDVHQPPGPFRPRGQAVRNPNPVGAVCLAITGVLGYVRARDALEHTIFNQLTATRETKSHQVETYFRSIRAEMRLLAAS